MLSSGQSFSREAYVIPSHDLPVYCLHSDAKPRSHEYYRYYSTVYVSFLCMRFFSWNRIFILRKLAGNAHRANSSTVIFEQYLFMVPIHYASGTKPCNLWIPIHDIHHVIILKTFEVNRV